MSDDADQAVASGSRPDRGRGRNSSRDFRQVSSDAIVDEDQRMLEIQTQQAALEAEYAGLQRRKAEKAVLQSMQEQIQQESGLRQQAERDLAAAQSENQELVKAQEKEREEATARLQQSDKQHSAANRALVQSLEEAREQLSKSQQTVSVLEQSTQQLSQQLASEQEKSQEDLHVARQRQMIVDAALKQFRAREVDHLRELGFLRTQAEFNSRTIDELSKQPRFSMEAGALPVNRRPLQSVYGPVGEMFPVQTRGFTSQALPSAPLHSQNGMADTSYPCIDAPYPPADASYPPADAPYPAAGASYPPAEASHPPADVQRVPADAPYPPADAPYPPAEGQAASYSQDKQVTALPASLSLQESQEAVPAQQSSTTNMEAADDTPHSFGAISVSPRDSQDGTEGARELVPDDVQRTATSQAARTDQKRHTGVIDGQAFLAKLQKKDSAALPQLVGAPEQPSLGAVPAVHAEPTASSLPSAAPVQASRAEPLELQGNKKGSAGDSPRAGANAAPLVPVYVPAMPAGHFAALSAAVKQEYTETVLAAQNANRKSFVSYAPALSDAPAKQRPGKQYVTPLHPDDPAKRKPGATQNAGRRSTAAKGAQQPRDQHGPQRGGVGGARGHGRGGKKKKNKNKDRQQQQAQIAG